MVTERRPPCQYFGTVSSSSKRRLRTIGVMCRSLCEGVAGSSAVSTGLWCVDEGCGGRLRHAKFRSLQARMSAPDEPFTLPAVHALHLAEVVKSLGTPQNELFGPLGLDPEGLAVPGARIEVPAFAALVTRARKVTGNDAIGILLGLQMRASAHGYLGFAAMTASTLREALETATRFVPTRTNALGLSLHVGERTASLVIEERTDFSEARDAVLFALAVGIWQMGDALTGRQLEGSADFAFPRPAYTEKFANVGPVLRFAQPATQLVFDASALELPLTMADPVSRQLVYSELERSLEELGGDQ